MYDDARNASEQSRADLAYDHLQNQILTGRLAAGAPIQERRVAAEIGLSRSPVRDALGRLAGEGLLARDNANILRVREITLRDYLLSLDMRLLLEPAAAAVAAETISQGQLEALKSAREALDATDDPEPGALTAFDDALHVAIAANCANPFMERSLTEMRRYTTVYEQQEGRRPRRHVDAAEHRRILDALLRRSPAQAAEAARLHLQAIRHRALHDT